MLSWRGCGRSTHLLLPISAACALAQLLPRHHLSDVGPISYLLLFPFSPEDLHAQFRVVPQSLRGPDQRLEIAVNPVCLLLALLLRLAPSRNAVLPFGILINLLCWRVSKVQGVVVNTRQCTRNTKRGGVVACARAYAINQTICP